VLAQWRGLDPACDSETAIAAHVEECADQIDYHPTQIFELPILPAHHAMRFKVLVHAKKVDHYLELLR
jgi:hypothetical protein